MQLSLFDQRSIVDIAIARLQEFVPKDGTPYWLAFSGGKDSVVIYDLARRSGVPFEAHYNITTIDPPELVKFIVQQYPEVIRDKPEKSFWRYLFDKGFPMRNKKWCCLVLKEKGGRNRRVLTGVRWAESARRAKQRKLVEQWSGKNPKTLINPIVDWKESDVWEYIHRYQLKYCSLYDHGFTRLGCIGCPESRKARAIYLNLYPHVERMYRATFRKYYAKKKAEGKGRVDRWKDGDEMFDWWMISDPPKKDDEEQGCLQFQ